MVDAINREFPIGLLERSVDERVNYFDQVTFRHKHYTAAREKLRKLILHPHDVEVIGVFGPTGAGKSALVNSLMNELFELEQAAMQQDPGYIPAASMLVALKDNRFSWRDHNGRALEILGDVLIPYKLDYRRTGIRQRPDGRIGIEATANTAALGWALIQALTHRRLRAYFWDESQKVTQVVGSSTLETQIEIVRSLVQESRWLARQHGLLNNRPGVVIVLVGTYDLLSLLNLTDQSCRRIADVHLPRYHLPKDKTEFRKILHTFAQHMPLEELPLLAQHYDYFHERSGGLMGVLKRWLTEALRDALEKEQRTLTEENLERCKLPKSKLDTMLVKIDEGEKLHAQMDNQSTYVSATPTLQSATVVNTQEAKKQKGSGASRGRRPGQRKPKRDIVGMDTGE